MLFCFVLFVFFVLFVWGCLCVGVRLFVLSVLEFLQRCNLLIAPPQPPQLPVPISPLDAAVQTLPHSAASQDVSTQTCARPVSSLSLDAAVQTPLHSVVAHDVSTQLPLTEFFIG